MTTALQIAIIGCGFIGQKRARSIGDRARVKVCCDFHETKAESLARQYEADFTTDWQNAIARESVGTVFVCTSHDLLAPIAEYAVSCGKHVLIEKPGARRADELASVMQATRQTDVRVRVGFNHRYHRALQKAREICDSGGIGDLLYIRGRYGHGGRIGYDTEWRAIPDISGGGEAIDQGVHLIDLARWFLGDLHLTGGSAPTYFWKMPVEDNAFLLLETAKQQVAFLHASWTEWKNLFSFEICGRTGKLEVTGLGGSYGTERLAHYQMLPEMGPPLTTVYEYPMADNSWELEFSEFLQDIELGRTPQPGLAEAQAALQIVEQLYARTHRT